MFAVLITIHVVACTAMIVMILLQRSEGGGLGLGTGGGVGGLMTGRGAANALTRTTVIFAAVFISTSIALAVMAKSTRGVNPLQPSNGGSLSTTPLAPLEGGAGPLLAPPAGGTTPAPAPASPSAIPVPSTPAPAAPAPAAPAGAQPAPQPSTPTPAN